MTSSTLLGLTTFAYLAAAVLYIGIFVFRASRPGIIATITLVAAFAINTAGIGLRWIESHQMGIGYAPLSNMYESLVFFAWCIGGFYLGLEWKYKNRNLGAFAVPFAFLSMAYASFSPQFGKEIKPLIPALQSNWLIAHVVTCFIGYAAFAVAAGFAIMYLLKEKKSEGLFATLPDLKTIDDLIHKTIVFGFLWLSAGIITGAVWANSAWGTWSLITWFLYAATLHARFTRGWGGKRIAWLAILGFLAVVFTYYGVNFLLSGLHSYGG